MLPWQPILVSKCVKSAYSLSFVAPAFQNVLEDCNFDFKKNSLAFISLHVYKFVELANFEVT